MLHKKRGKNLIDKLTHYENNKMLNGNGLLIYETLILALVQLLSRTFDLNLVKKNGRTDLSYLNTTYIDIQS